MPAGCSSGPVALHDLAAAVGGALPVEAFGDSLDLEAQVQALRISG
jgi:hypothetical protein